MKTLFKSIAAGDVPVEWALGTVAAAGILILVAWYFLTRDNKPAPARPSFGAVLMFLGLLGLGYFYFLFDVSVGFNGQRIANLDLLSQRQNGILISGFLFLAGIIVLAVRKAPRRPEAP
jgi:tellurite resistance protein TehA-like permease